VDNRAIASALVIFGLVWLIARRVDAAEKRSRDALAELRAIRARLDAIAVLASPPPAPPSRPYRWDYRTGEWRPMDESDDA
jgi:hypothetical protein